MSTNPFPSRPRRLAIGCLAASLFGACGASEEGGAPAAGTPAPTEAASAAVEPAARPTPESPVAAAPTVAPTATPAESPGTGRYARGLETLETGYDLSSISSQAAPSDEGLPRLAVADDGPPTGGLVRPGSRSKASLSFAEGGPSFDLGVVRQGESRDHVFQLVSDGEEPVVIKAIKPSCGCTKAEVSLLTDEGSVPYRQGDPIEVGQRLGLFTRISTEGKHGDFAATVSLYTNDQRGPFSVRVTAKIEPVLVTEPDQAVFFREMTTADRKESTVQLYSNRGEPFRLEVNEASLRPPLSAELEPIEPDEQGRASRWSVKVILGPDSPIGMRNYPLILDSDLPIGGSVTEEGEPRNYSATIAVQARVIGLVNAEPGFVSFGMVRPGQVLERTVRLQCHDDFQLAPDMPITIEGLYGQKFPYPDAFTTELVPVEGGNLLDLRLRLEGLPDEVNGSFGGILKLAVGHPSMEELSVRFSGVCRPGLAGG